MAFNTKSNTPANTNTAGAGNNDSWKAQGFINLYLPTKDGKRRKLGAIPLRESSTTEAPLLAWLNADPSRVKSIMAQLVMEFQSAEPAEGTAFALPDVAPEPESTPKA